MGRGRMRELRWREGGSEGEALVQEEDKQGCGGGDHGVPRQQNKS